MMHGIGMVRRDSTDGPRDIVATFEVLQCDYGFTAMSSGFRVPSEFAVDTPLEIILDNHSQTKTHVRS